jgi:type III secretion protein J
VSGVAGLGRGRALLALAAAAVLLAGCQRAELYTGLNEREANEMVAVVEGAGFTASKSTPDNGKTWTLDAPKGEFPQEVALLQARGYPRDRYESLGDVFKKQGFVSSPTEERARMMFGLSQELSHTISEIDGVVDARVHLAMPQDDPLADTQKPASASVFIKYDPSVDLTSQIGSIKALVVNSIEGLPYDKVTVVLSAAHPIQPAPRQASLANLGLPALLGCAVIGGAAGFGLWRRNRRRSASRELAA